MSRTQDIIKSLRDALKQRDETIARLRKLLAQAEADKELMMDQLDETYAK